MKRPLLCLLVSGLSTTSAFAAPSPRPDAAALDFFEKKIRPVLVDNCYRCHSASATKLKGGLSLDSQQGLITGGNSGPAIVAGNPDKSLLIKAIHRLDPDTAMPPKDKLSDAAVVDLTQWVKMGAPWPAEPAAKPLGTGKTSAEFEKAGRELWSWQPIRSITAPAAKDASWAKSDIDRFILNKLEAKGLTPQARADKATLIRRASFDLIGLPPTPDEVTAFLADDSSDAFEKAVDRLLASPHFGERWGRHWLDIARYAESCGMTRNVPYYYAWKYRDYVIQSFNQDKPYDQFIVEQLAGDLLPAKNGAERDSHVIATGFLALGTKDINERNPEQFVMNNVDEQIDVTSQAMLGMTIACARCHDHKFDPIPTKDYYSLAGIFRSTTILSGIGQYRPQQGPKGMIQQDLLVKLSDYKSKNEDWWPFSGTSQAKQANSANIAAARPQVPANLTPEQRAQFIQKQKFASMYQQEPLDPDAALAIGVQDSRRIGDTRILTRGEVASPGPIVGRGVFNIPSMQTPPAIGPSNSGRLELAQWITRKDNPLTSRVMVNRIWQHLFGQGIVRTSDNFGTTGEAPSHPELLDFLADSFMSNGWSVKKTIRQIMLSATYQQSSTFSKPSYAVDPDERLVWRMPQRRLEAEAIRDAMLAVTGSLDLSPAKGSPISKLSLVETFRMTRGGSTRDDSNHRSVYLMIYRNMLPESLDVFDAADPNLVTGDRDVTTVAPQALYMLNSPKVLESARKLASRVFADKSLTSDADRVERAYLMALGRKPTELEKSRVTEFLAGFVQDAAPGKTPPTMQDAFAAFCQAMFGSAEFRYLN